MREKRGDGRFDGRDEVARYRGIENRAKEDDAADSTGVVLFDLWTKSTEDVEALRMTEAKDAMDSSSAPLFS